MALSIILSRAQVGIDAPRVSVETHISNGLPSLSIVGLPELAVRESKERVRSALINSGFEFPTRRVTINLAPADLPKQGGRYDLAIAIGILCATGQIESAELDAMEFIGELGLTGDIRPITGVLPSVSASQSAQNSIFIPYDNANEASLAEYPKTFAATHLLEICQHLKQITPIKPVKRDGTPHTSTNSKDLTDVHGQYQARRALEIAAAGRHNLLFYGPPGTGKSMLASRLPGILPPLQEHQALEVASIYSLSNTDRDLTEFHTPPFRSPHHTASAVSLVGGGSTPKPGEISLAHNGVLFLDELPEYARSVLEVLREPIESGEIKISRANSTLCYPSQFQLLAAMNPCPCGYSGHPTIPCTDTPQQISNYRRKLSGPLLDRFDLHVEVSSQPGSVMFEKNHQAESSANVLSRVTETRARQLNRQSLLNHALEGQQLMDACGLDQATQHFMENAMNRLSLSARAAHRTLRVARTIADLESSTQVELPHITEALSYRTLDRKTV